jgi:hypothetical protein
LNAVAMTSHGVTVTSWRHTSRAQNHPFTYLRSVL